jgi:hypothetical protein
MIGPFAPLGTGGGTPYRWNSASFVSGLPGELVTTANSGGENSEGFKDWAFNRAAGFMYTTSPVATPGFYGLVDPSLNPMAFRSYPALSSGYLSWAFPSSTFESYSEMYCSLATSDITIPAEFPLMRQQYYDPASLMWMDFASVTIGADHRLSSDFGGTIKTMIDPIEAYAVSEDEFVFINLVLYPSGLNDGMYLQVVEQTAVNMPDREILSGDVYIPYPTVTNYTYGYSALGTTIVLDNLLCDKT